MSKFKKIIIVTVCLIILVVPFTILFSSAAETVYQPDVKVAFGDFAISDVMVMATRESGFIDIDRITFLKLNDNRVRVNIIPEGEQFRHHDTVRVAFVITPTKSEYFDSSFNTIGSFSVGMKLDGMKNFKLSSLGSSMRQSSSTYDFQSPEIEEITTHWGHYKRFHYLDRSKGYSFDSYYVSVEYTVVNTAYDYSRYIYVQDFDFDSLTDTEFDKKELNEVLTPHTDKIMNGDEDIDSKGEANKVDGAMGDIGGATDNAMGGKTDEQVQEEINNALDSDSIGLDFNKAQRISTFFDDTLSAFGVSYKTLLMLSLSLGLAAFLIGRRYS